MSQRAQLWVAQEEEVRPCRGLLELDRIAVSLQESIQQSRYYRILLVQAVVARWADESVSGLGRSE
jgi:hypothetical protein